MTLNIIKNDEQAEAWCDQHNVKAELESMLAERKLVSKAPFAAALIRVARPGIIGFGCRVEGCAVKEENGWFAVFFRDVEWKDAFQAVAQINQIIEALGQGHRVIPV